MEISEGVKGNSVECATLLDAIKRQQKLRPYATSQNKLFLSTNSRLQNTFFWTNCDKAANAVIQNIRVDQNDEVLFLKKPFRAMQALGA